MFNVFKCMLAICFVIMISGYTFVKKSTLTGSPFDLERTLNGTITSLTEIEMSIWFYFNPKQTLVLNLNSNGGSAIAGFDIQKMIQDRTNVQTKILTDKFCASACTFIWLAAEKIIVENKGVLAFHGVYCDNIEQCDFEQVKQFDFEQSKILQNKEPKIYKYVLAHNAWSLHDSESFVWLARLDGKWLTQENCIGLDLDKLTKDCSKKNKQNQLVRNLGKYL